MSSGPSAAAAQASIEELDRAVSHCRACPRLVQWREQVAQVKRRAFADEDYWGRPVPGFGPADAAMLIVGLAPAAHGANRTGRMFTGDRSGDVLFAGLHAAGLASQPASVHRGDGLRLAGVRITAPVHCAPPANTPTPAERDTCRPWLQRELALLRPGLRVIVVLGAFGWQALWPVLAPAFAVPSPRPVFGHGREVVLPARDGGPELLVIGCYHVSQQNTFTGRLTPAMLLAVLQTAATAAGLPANFGDPAGSASDVAWKP